MQQKLYKNMIRILIYEKEIDPKIGPPFKVVSIKPISIQNGNF